MSAPINPRRVILASHLVFMGYGHWLANDPRGSGSQTVRKDELKPLGDIHLGRKRVQPSRETVKHFYREASPLLDFDSVWFNQAMRDAIADSVGRAIAQHGYTLFAFSVCSNHMHVLARTHRDRSDVIWSRLANATRDALRATGLVREDHPVWSHRPYKVFKYTPEQVRGCVRYIEENPRKERLPAQRWDFVSQFR